MPLTRRHLLHQTVLAAAATATAHIHAQMQMSAPAKKRANTLDATRLTPFVDPLPLPITLPLADHYRIHMRQVTAKLHRDLPPTTLFTYGETSAPILIEAHTGQPITIDWVNDLPAHHILPLDPEMPHMEGMHHAPPTRAIAHLHGGRVPHESDGYPEDWFGPGETKRCLYPNHQDATALWFHDHAMGVSRLNVFAGLMGFYLLRDAAEAALHLPTGPYELPLMLYDRSLTPAAQLYYPNPPDQGAWATEFLGDALLVNGKIKPFHPVEPRLYRLRILNASHSRFFSLQLSTGAAFHIIGSDQGLLAAPVEARRLVLAPAERADLLIDFASHAGQNVVLQSDGLDLLQFRIASGSREGKKPGTPASRPAQTLSSRPKGSEVERPAFPPPIESRSEKLPATLRPTPRIPESRSIRTRIMTLNEFESDNGEPMVMLLNRKHWADPVTEIVKLNTTEIWSLLNLTDDTHPIHLHLVRFQLLDRQSFSTDDYLANETLRTTGPILPPAPHELGWKDVIQCPPGTITRIIVPFTGYTGRYLWHCHILEHEANDMMRPFDVIA